MVLDVFRVDMNEAIGAEGAAWSLKTDVVSLYLLRGKYGQA